MILVSACLCGINTKYDGGNNFNNHIYKLLKEGKALLVCPEQLGGLTTPREPHEIQKGTGREVLDGEAKVISISGKDSTAEFIKGAEETLKLANSGQIEYAVLKANSPSCGCGSIYDGSFTGRKISGNGVTAELLLKNGIKVISEKEAERIEL